MFRYVLVLLFSLTPLCYALDPPEVLFEWSTENWQDFCNVGDQNGDGSDDLIVSHMFTQNEVSVREVLIFFGGVEMDDEPDWTYRSENEDDLIGRRISFIGKISEEHSGCFNWDRSSPSDDAPTRRFVDIFFGEEELDDEIDIALEEQGGGIYYSSVGRFSNKFDVNSDGYDDFVVKHITAEDGKSMELYLGDEQLNIEPDWKFEIPEEEKDQILLSSGCDVNSDGFDDMLVKLGRVYEEMTYRLFLGGESISEEPILSYPYFPWEEGEEHFPKQLRHGFSLLKDVNGDGFDDWAHLWDDTNYHSGMLVFFGSDEPNFEPDVELVSPAGDLSGGDFNGDGYGDIATCSSGALYIYFGRDELNSEADIEINLAEEYNISHCSLGAIGDYNGDGSDDIAIGGGQSILTILAGWKNESVEYEPVPVEHELNFTAYPNPFNSSVELSFTLGFPSRVNLSIYDIQGRLVEQVVAREMALGDHTLTWSAERAGVYLVKLESDGRQAFRKIVALK